MKKFLHTLFVVSFSAPVPSVMGMSAGVEMTLTDVKAEVRAGNPDITAARRQSGMLEADITITSSYPNPNIEIEKSVSGDPDAYEIKAAQPVPLTRRAGKAGAAARAGLEAAQKELEALETRVLSAARKAWYALRIARERRNFEETNLKFSMDLLNKIEMRLQMGEAGNADLARAKVEVSRSRLHLQEAETMTKLAAGELNGLMGRKPDSTLEISMNGGFSLSPATTEPEPLEKYTELALARRPERQAAALGIKASELAVSLEKGKRLPVPELGLIRGRDGGSGYSKLFLGLELPLWYANGGGVKRALAQKAALGYEASRLELAIRSEVYSSWLELGLARKRLESARETVFLLNDLRRRDSQDYLSGKLGLTAFYETNRIFLEENISYLDALQDYYGKAAQLDAAVNGGEAK